MTSQWLCHHWQQSFSAVSSHEGTIAYAACHWPKCHFSAHDCVWRLFFLTEECTKTRNIPAPEQKMSPPTKCLRKPSLILSLAQIQCTENTQFASLEGHTMPEKVCYSVNRHDYTADTRDHQLLSVLPFPLQCAWMYTWCKCFGGQGQLLWRGACDTGWLLFPSHSVKRGSKPTRAPTILTAIITICISTVSFYFH